MKKNYVSPISEVFDWAIDGDCCQTFIFDVSPAGVDQAQFQTSARVIAPRSFWK
ncbi:MAG: hypothetical protein MJZ75_04240 [Paludibacteraceae bacterium]|nr:hypothetical protein [Paludibacteraceae bacterium]